MKNALFQFILTFLAFGGLAFSACKTEHFAAEKLPARQIRFGTGGGFTGKTSTFVLLENGQIFEQNIFGNGFLEKPAIKKSKARGFFKTLDGLPAEAAAFDRPANFYYFLENRRDSATVRAVWGDVNFPPPQKVSDLFFALNALVFTKPSDVKN